MPSSRVRWVTVNAITPYSPTLARTNAIAANAARSDIIMRREPRLLAMLFSIVEMPAKASVRIERLKFALDGGHEREGESPDFTRC